MHELGALRAEYILFYYFSNDFIIIMHTQNFTVLTT